MTDAAPGGGRVEFELDGKPVALVPSLEACLEISKLAGGLAGAFQRCQMLNFETILAIVGVGIEIEGHRLNPGQRQKLLPGAIYNAGVVAIAAHCMNFITIIGRGGRPLDLEGDEDDDGDEGAAAIDGEAPLAQ